MTIVADTKPYVEPDPVIGYRYIPGTRLSLPRPGGGSIPAVAVTAYSSHYDTTRIAEGGFEIVLTKPVDPFQLSSTIAFLVGR